MLGYIAKTIYHRNPWFKGITSLIYKMFALFSI